MTRIQYKTALERQDIFKNQKETEYWVKEESSAEGNFIVFDSAPLKNTQDKLTDMVLENTALKAEKEVLLQAIAEKDQIILEKDSILQEKESIIMQGMMIEK